jgi:methionine sulfoxide reductase heme-binding subunit
MAEKLPWLKPGVFVGSLTPLAVLLGRAARGSLGANPIAEGLNQLGLVALIFLVASLLCTPLKTLLGWTWPVRIRRMLGLYAFFYACLHVATYAGLDQSLAWGAIVADVVKRNFILVGFLAWLCLLPLAVTSTNAMVRRLGFARWKALHRLAYAAGILGVIHFTWRVKKDIREPATYAAVLSLAFLVRLADAARKAARRRIEETGSPPGA